MNGPGRWNGAFYYSQEIVNNIIPNVKTDRNWITINVPGVACDHSVVFIHNNKTPEAYGWLSKYKDLVLVCGVPETCEKVSGLGKAVYLPLSIDTTFVSGSASATSCTVAAPSIAPYISLISFVIYLSMRS